jgi:regulation of enolase protein 1 (concanavalin A-like superfamily)
MNTTFHIIRKDLRFNRWALLLWLTAVLTHFAFRCMQIKDPDWGGRALASSSRLDHIILFALPLMIIPFLMQADAYRRRYAFWQSLPISKTRLLLAKAITLLSVFILLPMAFEITYYFLAGLETVLWSSLKIWLYLHVPLVLIAYFLCYLTPGWKSYFCLMLPVAAVGMKIVVASIVNYPKSAFLPHPNAANIHNIIEAPAGITFQIDEKTARIRHSYFRKKVQNVPEKYMIESVIRPSVQMQLRDLPADHVIWDLSNDIIMKSGKKEHKNLFILSFGQQDSLSMFHSGGEAITHSGAMMPPSILGEKSARNTFLMTLIANRGYAVPMEDIPDDGIVLEGFISLQLAKKIVVHEMPYGVASEWRQGLHAIKVPQSNHDPSSMKLDVNVTLESIISDEDLQDPSTPFPPNGAIFMTVEHERRPLNYKIQQYVRRDWYVYPEGLTDISRYRKRSKAGRQLSVTESRDQRPGQLALLRFQDEENEAKNWKIKAITYEPQGTIKYPFSLRIAKPLNAIKPQIQPDELPPEQIPLATQLKKIDTIDAQHHLRELERILGKLDSSDISRNEQSLYPALQKIFAADAAYVIKSLKDAADKEVYTQKENEMYEYNTFQWAEYKSPLPAFWQRVNGFLTTAVREEHKILILENLHPIVDQTSLLTRMEWRKEAAPIIAKILLNERMPQCWAYLFESFPSPETHQALLKQMQLGNRSVTRVIQWIEQIPEPELQKEAAAEFWETAVRHTNSLESLRLPLLIALKYGVEVAPRDMSRLIKADGWQSSDDQPAVDRTWLSLLQILALYSECPTDLNEGKKWMILNGRDLRWNASALRFELFSGDAKSLPNIDESIWGKIVNPIGVGRFEPLANTNALRVTSSAYPADYTTDDFLRRFSPRLMRDVKGDFTAQVTIFPEFSPSPSSTNNPDEILQAAGLVLEAGQTNHLRIDLAMQGRGQAKHIRERIVRVGNVTNYNAIETPEFDPRKPITLRIARHGSLCAVAWKQGEAPWNESKAHLCVPWYSSVKIGMYVSNTCIKPFRASFQDYQISNSSVPPQALHLVKLAPTPGSPQHGDEIKKWGTFHNLLNGGSVKTNGQEMKMRVTPRMNDFNFRNLVVAPRTINRVKGDFIQEVTIEPALTSQKWMGAALYFQDGYNSMFRLGPCMWDKPSFEVHSSGYSYAFQIPPYSFSLDPQKTVRLRIRRVGNLFYAAVKQEGDWQEMAPFYLKCPDELMVGVVGMNTSAKEVDFTFRDYSLKTGP